MFTGHTIRIRYDDAIRPNTNRLFGPLFGTEANTNRIFSASLVICTYEMVCIVLSVCLVQEASMEVYFSCVWRADCPCDASVAANSVLSPVHLVFPMSA